MSNQLLKSESYELLVNGRALAKLNREFGYGNAGRKHKADAPGDYQPGASDDFTKGYHFGSTMLNEKGEAFMCISSEEGKANWIKLGSLSENATETSYIVVGDPKEVESKPSKQKPKPEPQEEGDKNAGEPDGVESEKSDAAGEDDTVTSSSGDKDAVETDKSDGSGGSFKMGTESGPNKGKTAIPDDMPWDKYLKQNGLKYVEQVQEASDKGELKDMKYLNKDRADDIAKWLDEN